MINGLDVQGKVPIYSLKYFSDADLSFFEYPQLGDGKDSRKKIPKDLMLFHPSGPMFPQSNTNEHSA